MSKDSYGGGGGGGGGARLWWRVVGWGEVEEVVVPLGGSRGRMGEESCVLAPVGILFLSLFVSRRGSGDVGVGSQGPRGRLGGTPITVVQCRSVVGKKRSVCGQVIKKRNLWVNYFFSILTCGYFFSGLIFYFIYIYIYLFFLVY